MITIELTERPVQGKRERACHMCGEVYYGWNFVRCLECEERFPIVEIIRNF